MKKLTKDQGLVVTGFTGIMATSAFSDFHADVEKRLGRPIMSHQFADDDVASEIKEAYRADFMAMIDGFGE